MNFAYARLVTLAPGLTLGPERREAPLARGLIGLATKYKLLQFYDLSPQEYRQKTLKVCQITQNKLHNYKI